MPKRRMEFDANLPSEVREEELVDIATKVAWPKFDNIERISEVKDFEKQGSDDDITRKYIVEVGALPLLKPAEERALFKLYVKKRNPEVRERIIRHNLRLVIYNAKRYRGRGLDFLDLIQEGNIGLMQAVETFEPERELKFSTYATWWIRQSIGRAIVNTGGTIRVPNHMVDHLRQLRTFEEEFFYQNRRYPSVEELAGLTGLSQEKVKKVQIARRGLNPLSFESPRNSPKGDNDDITLGDSISDERSGRTSLLVEARLELALALRDFEGLKARLVSRFSPRNVRIYLCRYGLDNNSFEGRTLDSVGLEFGCTRERIRQITAKMNSRLGKTDQEMREFTKRLSQLSELSVDVPEVNQPIKVLEVVETLSSTVHQYSEAVRLLREKIQSLPIIEQKVFLTYYGLEDRSTRGLEETVMRFGFGKRNVERIIQRVWVRLKASGYKYSEQVLLVTVSDEKRD